MSLAAYEEQVEVRLSDLEDRQAALGSAQAEVMETIDRLVEGLKAVVNPDPAPVPDPTPEPAPVPVPSPPVPSPEPFPAQGARDLAISSKGWPDALADALSRQPGVRVNVFEFAHFGAAAAMIDPELGGWDLADMIRYLDEGISPGDRVELTMQPSAWPIRDRSVEHEAWVRQWARLVAAWQGRGGYPLRVAFGHEMSGEWTNKSSWNAQDWSIRQGGSDPEDFAAWFRWVVDLCRAEGAVILPVFAPATIWPEHVELVKRAYPGDDWVHSVGLSWYPHSGGLWPERRGLEAQDDFLSLENQFEVLSEVAPGKPVSVNEFGFGTAVLSVEMIDSFFRVLARWNVDVIKFFNWFKPQISEEQDYRLFDDRELQSNPGTDPMVRDQMADYFMEKVAGWQS